MGCVRRARQLLALLPLLALACASAPKEHYFMMAYLPPFERTAVVKHPYTLRLKSPDISLAYDKEKIVYRYSQFEFEYYHYQLWAVKPQKMVADLLRRYITDAGCFERVVTQFTEHKPDFELTGEILAIEELDSGDAWFAHLAINLRLTRYRSDRVVWTYGFDEKKPVHNKAPVYVVKALSEIFEEQAVKAIADLNQFLHRTQRAAPADERRATPQPEPEPEPGAAGSGPGPTESEATP